MLVHMNEFSGVTTAVDVSGLTKVETPARQIRSHLEFTLGPGYVNGALHLDTGVSHTYDLGLLDIDMPIEDVLALLTMWLSTKLSERVNAHTDFERFVQTRLATQITGLELWTTYTDNAQIVNIELNSNHTYGFRPAISRLM